MSELVDKYIYEYKQLVEKNQIRLRTSLDVSKYLSSFKKVFGDLSIEFIIADDLDDWLDNFSPTNRANHKKYANQFLRHCVKQKENSSNPMDQTRSIRRNNKQPEIYDVLDVVKVLKCSTNDMIPYLTIGFFAGIRPTELERLEWKDIDFELKEIRIRADVSKTKDIYCWIFNLLFYKYSLSLFL